MCMFVYIYLPHMCVYVLKNFFPASFVGKFASCSPTLLLFSHFPPPPFFKSFYIEQARYEIPYLYALIAQSKF